MGIGVAALLLPVMGLALVDGLSERRLRTFAPPPAFTAAIPTDSVSLARGRHLLRTRGCFGCHGDQLEGQVFEEWVWVKRAVAPNLARHARAHDAQTLANAIRAGVGADGRALWSMPSYNFRHLPDEDIAAIIGALRSAEVIQVEHPAPALGWTARWAVLTDDAGHMADWAARVPPLQLGDSDDPQLVRGERLAMTTCNECHGLDLRGAWVEGDIAPPDLAIVAGYSPEEFTTLMRTGVPKDGRDLGLMAMVAKDRFAAFSDDERRDLYAYLQSLPSRPIATGVFWRPGR